MKKIFVFVVAIMWHSHVFCQVRYPNFQDTLVNVMNENRFFSNNQYASYSLDSNMEYKYIKDGLVMQGGQIKIVRRGNLYPMESPITLKNGSIVMPDGIIKMTNGNTPILKEEDFIDMDGNILPLNREMYKPVM